MDFKAVIKNQQDILRLELEIARQRFKHYGLRGDALEKSTRNFLEQHLPRSLNIGTGEVIATESDTGTLVSAQTDIVISSDSQPFITERDTPTTFLIEAVHSAGEVKASLSRPMMKEELTKAAKFKALKAKEISTLVAVKGIACWQSYYNFYRPYFLLAYETATDWRTILLETLKHIKEHRKMPLDAIFLLDKNIVIIISPHIKSPFLQGGGIPFRHSVSGYPDMEGTVFVCGTDAPIALLVMWLSCFRAGFFGNHHPLSFYLPDALNASLTFPEYGRVDLTPENVAAMNGLSKLDQLIWMLEKECNRG